jgi:hypothetical protein
MIPRVGGALSQRSRLKPLRLASFLAALVIAALPARVSELATIPPSPDPAAPSGAVSAWDPAPSSASPAAGVATGSAMVASPAPLLSSTPAVSASGASTPSVSPTGSGVDGVDPTASPGRSDPATPAAGSAAPTVGTAAPSRTAAPTRSPSATPRPTAQAGWPATGARPYLDGSAWNTPISSNAAVDSHSTAMIAGVIAEGALRSDPGQYTYPVYFADGSTPRVTLSCTHLCSTVTSDGRLPSTSTMTIPLPPGVRPSAGDDGQAIIVDRVSGDEYDLYRYDPSTRTAQNASRYVGGVYRDGTPSSYVNRGAGVPYLAGLIRPWEISAGRIDHALAFGYAMTRATRCVFPASKTDGDATSSDAIPEGARIRLDPSLNVDAIAGLDRAGRIIARALQRYGAVLVDTSGSNKLYAESSLTASWAGLLGAGSPSAIPLSRLQVMALPPGVFSSDYTPTWGGCLR